MRNARLDEAQAGIKTARSNINNLRYADDITIMAESKEELKNLLMRVKKESENTALKLNFGKTKVMASSPMTSWQIEEENMEIVIDLGGFPGGAAVKNPPANTGAVRDVGLIPGSGRSPGGGNGNPLQYSCLGNPMDRGVWQVKSMGSQKSQT